MNTKSYLNLFSRIIKQLFKNSKSISPFSMNNYSILVYVEISKSKTPNAKISFFLLSKVMFESFVYIFLYKDGLIYKP